MATWYILADPGYPGKVMAKSGAWPTAETGDTRNSDIQTIANARTAGDIVIVGAGTYSALMLSSANTCVVSKAITIRSPQVGDDQHPLHAGQVVFDGGSIDAIILYISIAGIVVERVKLQGGLVSGAQKQVQGDYTWTGNDLEFEGGRQALLQGSGICTLNRPVFHGATTGSLASGRVQIESGAAGSVINFPIFKNCNGMACAYVKGNCTLNHPVFVDTTHAAVMTSGATCTVNNPILSGISQDNGYPFMAPTGAIVVNNPVLSGGAQSWGRISSGTVTINGPRYTSPRFGAPNRPSLLLFGIDDIGNLATFATLAGMLETYGWRGCYALNSPASVTSGQLDTVADLITRGHCITAHADHFANNLNDLRGLSISYSGSGAAVCTITTAGSAATNITVAIDGTTAVSVDITSSTLVPTVVSAIDAHAELACVKTNAAVNSSLYARYLSAAASVALSGTATEFGLEADLVYDDEMTAPKVFLTAAMQARGLTDWVCDVWTCPGNDTDAQYRAQLVKRGYTVSRGEGISGGLGTSTVMSSTFGIKAVAIENVCGSANPTQENVNIRIIGLIEAMQAQGSALCLMGHTSTDFSLAGWGKVLKAINECAHVNVVTLPQAAEFIRTYDPSGDLATADGMTYTRTFLDEVDVRLLATSQAVHGGVVVDGVNNGSQVDPWGNEMLDYPNIGPDQQDYAPGSGPWATFDGTMPDLTLPASADFAVEQVQVWKKAPSLNQINRVLGG